MKIHFKRITALVLCFIMVLSMLPALATSTGTINTAGAKLYSTPYSSTAKLLYTLDKGTTVTVSAVSGSCAKVIYKGVTCYMSAAQVTIGTSGGTSGTTTNTKKATVKVTSLVIYSKASTSSSALKTLTKGATVTLLATSGSWAAVQYNTVKGYCLAAGLSVNAAATPAPTASATAKPTATAAPTAAPTQAVVTAAPTASTGYLVNGACSAVTTSSVRMYKSKSTTAGYYGTFNAGVTLTVKAVDGKWAQIIYKDKVGYVSRAALKPADGSSDQGGTVTTSAYTHEAVTTATLYQKPSTGSKVLKRINAGTKVKVTATNGSWLKIIVGSNYCYALSSQFANVNAAKKAMVIVSTQTIYANASTASNMVTTVMEGSSITVYGLSGGWYKCAVSGKSGYIPSGSVAVNYSTYSTLSSGSTGNDVLTMQKTLENLGFFDGVPSGNYGSITASSVKRFQQAKGLNVTGIANAATLAAIYASNAPKSNILTLSLSSGATSNYVSRLQSRLLYKGYYSDNINGKYGATTTAAVKLFQKQMGLTVTGEANNTTIRALFASTCPTCTTKTKPAGSNGSTSLDAPDVTSDNEDIETVISIAMAQLGKPYVYGTAGPNSYDCSGLTYYCFKKIGITLPRSAYDVGYSASLGTRIAYSDLKRGDLVCFNTISDSDLSDHVGIYLGDGYFIHAPHTGKDVLIAQMNTGYYKTNFSWGRRVIK